MKRFAIQFYVRPVMDGDKVLGFRVCYGEYNNRDAAIKALLSFPGKDKFKGIFANSDNGCAKITPSL